MGKLKIASTMFSLIFTTLGQGKSVAKEFGEAWSAVFSKTNNEAIKFSKDFTTALNKNIGYINDYKNAVDGGMSETEAMAKHLASASTEAKEYAASTNVAEISTEQFARSQKSAEIATAAQTKSLTNIRTIINTYNAGADKLGLTTEEFNKSVKESNGSLGTYLSSLNGVKASMGGYIKSLVSAKLSTIALSVASAALNAAISFGISVVIQGLITSISELVHREEKLIEKSEEAKSAIQSINDEFKENSKTVNDTSERFATLAQKVEDFGKLTQNKGTLSTEEDEEFLNLSNQLAGIFPELTKGYDDNGNAILGLSGDVNTIVSSLDDLIDKQKQLANQEIIKQLPDLYSGFTINVKNARAEVKSAQKEFDRINDAYKQLSEYGSMSFAFDVGGNYRDANGNIVDNINNIRGLASALGLVVKETQLFEKVNDYGAQRLAGTLLEIEGSVDDNFTSKLENARKNLQYAKDNLENELSSIDSYINTWLQGEWMYNKIDDTGLQAAVQQMLLSFDPSDLPEGVDSNNWEAVSEWIRKNILFAISNIDNEEVAKAISRLFSGDNLSLKELEGFVELIKGYFDEDSPVYLFIKPKIAEVDDAKNLADRVKKFIKDEFDDKVDELSIDDLEIAASNEFWEYLNVPDNTLLSWNKLCVMIKRYKKESAEISPPEITAESTISDLNKLSKGFEQLDKIYKDVIDGNGFDVSLIADNKDFKEKFSGLDSYTDFLATIVKYPNDIKKCQNAFNQLTNEYIRNSGVLDILNEDNKELVANYLKAMGVENADAIVSEQLALSKRRLAIEKEKDRIETELGTNASYESIVAKMQETNASGDTAAAYAQLAVEKMLVNDESIKSSKDIEALENLANAANATTSSLAKVAEAKRLMAEADKYMDYFNSATDPRGKSAAIAQYTRYLNRAKEELNGGLDYNEVDFSKYKFDYSGSDKTAKELASQAKSSESAENKALKAAKEAFTNEYNAHKHKVQMELETEKVYYDWLEKRSKEVYDKKIIDEGDYWKYQEEVFDGRRNLYKDYLNDIEHEISMHEDKINEDLDGESEKVISLYKTLISSVKDELQSAYKHGLDDNNDYVQELLDKLQSYKKAIIDILDEVVSEANGIVDGFQDVYTTLSDAAKEYTENGYLSVDSLQKILELSPKYLSMLADENGQLVVNEESLQAVIAAKTEELGAETALSYAKQILVATEQNEIQTLNSLTNANVSASNATWDMAYATIGLAKAIGVANGIDSSYYDNATLYISKMQSLTNTAVRTISVYYSTLKETAKESEKEKETQKDIYKEQQDGLETIIKLTEDLIKHENEDMIDGLEKQKKSYADIIEQKKNIINLAKKEEDHYDSINEKLKKSSKLQSQIASLSLDDSRSAQAQKKSLEEQLSELQKEIAKEQQDYYIDAQINALDEELEAFNDTKDAEIENLRNILSSTEKLYQAAINRIENNWDTLYSDLITWNYEYGSTLQSDLVNAWDSVSAAVQRYGTFVNALSGVKNDLSAIEDSENISADNSVSANFSSSVNRSADDIVVAMRNNSIRWAASSNADKIALEKANISLAEQYKNITGDSIYRTDTGWYHSNGSLLYRASTDEIASNIVSIMKSNASKWNAADSSTKKILENDNVRLAKVLSDLLKEPVIRKDNKWMIGNRELFSIYHSGGVVGGYKTLKDNEVMAILEEGEAVLDSKKEEGLYKIVDFMSVLSEKLGKTLDNSVIDTMFNNTQSIDVNSVFLNKIRDSQRDILKNIISPIGNENYTIEHIDVTAPINVVQKLDSDDIREHSKMIGAISADYIKEGFTKRGI